MVLAASVPSRSWSGSAPKRETGKCQPQAAPPAPTPQALGAMWPLRCPWPPPGMTAEPKRDPRGLLGNSAAGESVEISFLTEKCGRIESLCLLCGPRKAAEPVSLRNEFVALTIVKLALRCRPSDRVPRGSMLAPQPPMWCQQVMRVGSSRIG